MSATADSSLIVALYLAEVDSSRADAACELLTGHHWLLAVSQLGTERGGRPTFLYRLNPRAAK